MAQRPVVLVYQEFAALSTSPATPDLNCLIGGPAYWIQDFPDDRANILLASAYGTLNGGNPYSAPVAATPAVTITDAPNNKIGAVVDAASVKVYFGSPRVELVKYGVGSFSTTGTTTAGNPTMTVVAGDFVAAGVQAGDTAILTDGSANSIVLKVRSVTALSVTFTSDIPATGFTAGATTLYRIERQLADQQIDASFVTVTAGTNTINILGGVTLLVNAVAKPVNYAQIYVAYRSLRQDLAKVTSLDNALAITGQLGKIDARNPLAVGLNVAFANSNTPIQMFGITTDDDNGYLNMKAALASRKDVYAIVPLTASTTVLQAFASDCQNLADPNYALTNGIPQKFRVTIGGGIPLPTTSTLVQDTATGATQTFTGSAPAASYKTLNFTAGLPSLITSGVLPGDTVTLTADLATTSRNGSYVVTQVLSATSLQVKTNVPGNVQSATASVEIKQGSTATDRIALTATVTTATAADGDLYLDLYDPNATFVDSGVIATDLIKMPKPSTASTYTAYSTWVVASVVSNQRLRIVNNGLNTELVENELPHGVTREAPTALVPTTQTLHYEVVRTLDKAGQVSALQSVATSFANRRLVITWPDLVDVAGLVDGSLPRAVATTPATAASQPGYYLSCAVGGMTASLPSHQGFTNLGIAGISLLHDATPYFTDLEMTQISNSGWFVFQQDTEAALPYCIHQLTTDPSTLQFGEFSMVKNFDFVSMFFQDLLKPFIGVWNVNSETIGFIQSALAQGRDNLKLRKSVKIGAPINDAKITSVAQSTISSDRIEAYMQVNFPAPLNTVGLHLVSE